MLVLVTYLKIMYYFKTLWSIILSIKNKFVILSKVSFSLKQIIKKFAKYVCGNTNYLYLFIYFPLNLL